MIRLKDGVSLDTLRNYGFKTGREITEDDDVFFIDDYKYDWWFKHARKEDGSISMSDGDLPMVELCFKPDGSFECEIVPCYTYHCSESDVEVLLDTIEMLTKAGIIERI